MPLTRLVTLLLALAVLVGSVAGCGDDAGEDTGPERSATEHDAADVRFATDMVQHHAQALAMVDLTLGRDLDPGLAALAEEIRAAQAPEIETMVDWLTQWGEPVPETVRDHANSHSGGHGDAPGHDLPGMMSPQQMAELEAARGAEFERLFLELMVEHHRGAIEMAETQVAEGRFLPAVRLAERIAAAQKKEIAAMERMLG